MVVIDGHEWALILGNNRPGQVIMVKNSLKYKIKND